jgi:hypothetical protein
MLVPRSSGTPVATWAWPTLVVSRRRVLESVFVLLESSSPSRRIFISSHSLLPLWFVISVLQLLLHLGDCLMNGWMWRPAEAEAINRQAPRAKGCCEPSPKQLGRPAWAERPRPILARFGPVSLPDASRSIVDLLSYACGPLMSSSPRFRQISLSHKLQHLLSPWSFPASCFGPWALWSHVHDVS